MNGKIGKRAALTVALLAMLLVSLSMGAQAVAAVSTTAATSVLDLSATLNGNVAGFVATTVTVGFWWGTNATLATKTNTSAGTVHNSGNFTLALNGLKSGVKYYFKAWAKNGTAWYVGSILSFMTAGNAAAIQNSVDIVMVVIVAIIPLAMLLAIFGWLYTLFTSPHDQGGLLPKYSDREKKD